MNPLAIPDQRIIVGKPATLRWTSYDQDGVTADAGGAVTIGVTKADGTVVIASATATTSTMTGVYEYALAAANNLTLETLTASWTVAGLLTFTTTVEVAGGLLCTVADLRKAEKSLEEPSKYPTPDLAEAILDAEAECEWICDIAFVPRYRRAVVDGDGSGALILPDNQLRRIRSVRVYSNATDYTPFTTDELVGVQPRVGQDRTIQRIDGDRFPIGIGNVVVEYEHGYDGPPADLHRMFKHRARWWANQERSALPDRATRFTFTREFGGGGVYELDSATPYRTGMPDVDAAYGRYSRRAQAGATVPVSRPLNVDPSRGSLFHDGIR